MTRLVMYSRFWVGVFFAGLLVVMTVIPSAHAARTELDLGGTWQFAKVSQLNFPPTNSWQTMTVPGFLSGYQNEHAWFRRTFTIPAGMAGSKLKLRFGGVKYNAQVWLNGAFVGSYLNGYEPFEFDVTSAALTSQTNELIVGVTDWSATFAAPVDFSTKPSAQDARDFVKTNILAPIGGRYELYGPWQPVKLVSLPAVSIADVFVMPSVRSNLVTVRLTLRNDTASAQTVNLTNRVLAAGSPVLSLPWQQVTVGPLTNVSLDIAAPWTTAHLWSYLDPYLYSLETSISSPQGTDQMLTRFGFREFWAESGKFFLNGTPLNLLATATWPTTDLQTTNQIKKILQDVKAGNNVAIRFHTQPWDETWYEMADEVGLLIVEECAVWCDPNAYKLSDSTFWTNYSRHLSAAVQRDRNHPSIVLWSLENEILHCGGDKLYAATPAQLGAMGRVVKGMDPTRPITFEADLDPAGEASALGLHYPHEYPDYQVWPNAAWWMDQYIARSWMPGGQWKWDHTKPLYIGEFLWVPSSSPADFTIIFGDDAYADPSYYRNQAKGMTWRMAIEAYRGYGVNGIGPWTLFEDPVVSWGTFDLQPTNNYLYQVQKAAYEPNAVFPEEYNTRFFAGETAQRTVRIYNDRMTTNNLTLRWRAGSGAWASRAFTLPPAGQRRDTNSFTAPAAGPFALQFELSDTNGVVFTNAIDCTAMARPALTLPAGVKLALYDPHGTTSGLLTRFGLSFTTVTNLRTAAYDQFNLLLIGRDGLTNEPTAEVGISTLAARWQQYAAQGGWVLVLEQTNYPSFLPAEAQLQNFDASFAFPTADHPVVQGLTPNDLRWWADDHRLVAKALAMPARGNFRSLASIGSRNGMEYAAAVEFPIGLGGVLCSQWLLASRFDVEPLAGVLLQRLLNYCAPGRNHSSLRAVALLTETNSTLSAKVFELGLLAQNFLGAVTNCDSKQFPLFVIGGGNAAWSEAVSQLPALASYVDAGGKLLLHRPNAAFIAAAQPFLFPDLDAADATFGLLLRGTATNPAVRLTSHDLHWIATAGTWNADEVIATNIAQRYYRKRFTLASYSTIQVESMPIHSTGGASSGGWWLYANGYVAQDIIVSQNGTYLFNVLTKGTSLAGLGPHMTLKIDGRALDAITVISNTPAYYTLSAELTAGTHQLAVYFDNDAYAPPEDRNLFLDEIRWGCDADNSPTTLLTRPGAVAQVKRGNGLILLDEICWDTETQSTTKAARFGSTLLTALGGAFRQSPALGIEAESMTNVNVNAYSVYGGIAHLNSNGRVETSVRIANSGNYTFDVVAGGTTALGGFPQVAITVDGVNKTNWFLTTSNLIHYTFTLSLTAGTHTIGLAFLNDANPTGEDRNAYFDRLVITPQIAPLLALVDVDAAAHTTALQWEATPGKSYEVQFASGLEGSGWQVLTNILSAGTVAGWQDSGQLSGTPPLTPAAPKRFYRVRQTSP
ncbi:MAG: carbohydrate-binding domain-containing protein [Verrucomicrobiota bacterium]